MINLKEKVIIEPYCDEMNELEKLLKLLIGKNKNSK